MTAEQHNRAVAGALNDLRTLAHRSRAHSIDSDTAAAIVRAAQELERVVSLRARADAVDLDQVNARRARLGLTPFTHTVRVN